MSLSDVIAAIIIFVLLVTVYFINEKYKEKYSRDEVSYGTKENEESKDWYGIIGAILFSYSIISIFSIGILSFIFLIITENKNNIFDIFMRSTLGIIWFFSAAILFFVAPFIVMKSNDIEIKEAVAGVFRG